MPRLLLSRTCAGVGTTGICIDNTLVVVGGGSPAWMNAGQVVGNAQLPGDTAYHVITVDPNTGVASVLWPGEDGSDTLVAGAGVIAAGLKSTSPYTRLVNDLGRTSISGFIPWDVDRETGLAILTEYQVGTGLNLYPRNSHAANAVVTTGPLYGARSLSGIVTWTEGGAGGIRPNAYNFYTGARIALQSAAGNLYQALVITSQAGRRFLLYAMQDGSVALHPVDDLTHGYTLPAGDHFGLDAEVQSDGTLLVVWSSNAGESAGSQGSVIWSLTSLPSISLTPGAPSTGGPDLGGGPIGGDGDSWFQGIPAVTLVSTGTFEVAYAPEVEVTLGIELYPPLLWENGRGRIIHPILGAFDYEVKPDEWVNIDEDAIIPPGWASTRTLTSAANVLWQGNVRDVVIEERWTAPGGLSMPVTQFRMLLAIWTMPIDPDVGYVHWYPTYITQAAFKVLPMGLTAGGQGVTFDDIVNYKDENSEPVGWMTNPVTFTLKLVGKL